MASSVLAVYRLLCGKALVELLLQQLQDLLKLWNGLSTFPEERIATLKVFDEIQSGRQEISSELAAEVMSLLQDEELCASSDPSIQKQIRAVSLQGVQESIAFLEKRRMALQRDVDKHDPRRRQTVFIQRIQAEWVWQKIVQRNLQKKCRPRAFKKDMKMLPRRIFVLLHVDVRTYVESLCWKTKLGQSTRHFKNVVNLFNLQYPKNTPTQATVRQVR